MLVNLFYIPITHWPRTRQALLFVCAFTLQLPMHAATDVATIAANIVSTISLTNQSGLVFGDISSSAAAGTVVLSPSGARITTGGATVNSTVASGPAAFDVLALPNAVYAITLPASVILTEPGGNNMVVDSFSSSPTATGLTDAGGQQSLFVGATLNVSSNQSFGSYAGAMSVTVDYN